MATIDVQLQGQSFTQYAAEAQAGIAAAVGESTFDLEAEIKAGIQRVDAIDTGLMLNSTQGSYDGGMDGDVVTAADYWRHVNYGTAVQPARPFVEPAVDAVAPRHEQRLRHALQ